MIVENLIRTDDVTIIDVRSPEEYSFGHVQGSLNMPLNIIENYFDEIKAIKKPIVLCCASGTRSGVATSLLIRNGFENIHNGGSWIYVNNILKNKK